MYGHLLAQVLQRGGGDAGTLAAPAPGFGAVMLTIFRQLHCHEEARVRSPRAEMRTTALSRAVQG
jgi:hypothetical protein